MVSDLNQLILKKLNISFLYLPLCVFLLFGLLLLVLIILEINMHILNILKFVTLINEKIHLLLDFYLILILGLQSLIVVFIIT